MRDLRGLILLLLLAGPGPALGADPAPREIEIVSARGRQTELKIYSGESLTFRARPRRDGVTELFAKSEWLHGVAFTLRAWPKVKQDAIALVRGANRTVIREEKPGPALWGEPESTFTLDTLEPGRYRLSATKEGWTSDSVIIHSAALEIVDIDATLNERSYTASFDLRLLDPEEAGDPIPIRIETLDEGGRLVDVREDVKLVRIRKRDPEYRSNHTIRLSSSEVEGFRDRLARRSTTPLPPGFPDLKALRIAEGGSIRITLRNLTAGFGLPLGSG